MNLTKLARIPSCKLILKYINPNFRKTNTNLLIVGLTVFSSSPLSAASLRCFCNFLSLVNFFLISSFRLR